MDIDQRLEALAARHEALRESAELLLATTREHGSRIDKHESHKRGARLDKLLKLSEQDGEHIRAVARLAELHHERLMRLEGGPASG